MSTRLGRRAWRGYEPWADLVMECRREFMRVARGFGLIPELIPLPARDDLALLYCICRQMDDAVDDAPSTEDARRALDAWSGELRGRKEPRPLIAAFLEGAKRARLPMACLEHLLDGMELDLGPVRIADDDELVRYSYRVAAAVGLLVAWIVGMRDDAVGARVVDAGIAIQISNVIFGVSGDARRDRVYIPATRLAAVGLRAEDVLAAPDDPRLLPALRGLAELADAYYRSALVGVAHFPLRYRHGVILFCCVYAELGSRASRGTAIDPAHIPHSVKAVGIRALVATGWRPRTLGVLPAPAHDPALHAAIRDWPGANRWQKR